MALNLRFFYLQSALQNPSRRGCFQTECDAVLPNSVAKYVLKKKQLERWMHILCGIAREMLY